MPYQLLNRLCCATLPEVIGAQPEIEKLRFLKAQGLVEADIPESTQERGHRCYVGNAIVMCITQQGHRVAKQAAPQTPDHAPGTPAPEPERQSVPSPNL